MGMVAVDIEGIHSNRSCSRDIGGVIVSNHDAVGTLETLPIQEYSEKPWVGLTDFIVRRKIKTLKKGIDSQVL